MAGRVCAGRSRCAPRSPTRPRCARRIWSTASSGWTRRIGCSWWISPTPNSSRVCSPLSRSSSMPTRGRSWPGKSRRPSRPVRRVGDPPSRRLRSRQGHRIDGAIHHSDAGVRYTSVRFGEILSLSGLRPSVGSAGNAYNNALAETTRGALQERMHPCRLPVSAGAH
jgi:hypothetical protein